VSRGGHAHPNRHRGPDCADVVLAVTGVLAALVLAVTAPLLWRL
jgi:hypothetical protein